MSTGYCAGSKEIKMNLTTLLSSLGLGDGLGNTSSMRVITILVVLAVLVPRVVLAIQTRVIEPWSQQDLALLSIALGAKLVQNGQEAKAAV